MDQKVVEKQRKIETERKQKYDEHRKNYNYKQMESQFTHAIKEYDMQKNEQAKLAEDEKKQMLQKKKSYAQMVKSNYKPTISKKKQLEMQLLKENLANPARKRFRAGT